MTNSVILRGMGMLVLGLASGVFAAEPETYLNRPGKPLLEESFASGQIPAAFKPGKGVWVVVDGALEGREKPEDMHAATVRTDLALPEVFIARLDFRFDGAKAIHLSFNGKTGHVCRVTLTPAGFTMAGERDKKDEKDKNVLLGKVQQAFEPGRWYTLTCEIRGDLMLAYTDAEHAIFGRHEKIARAKTNFGFPIAGVSGRVDNVRVFAAEAHPDWEKHKDRFAAKAN